ncbi:RNA-directed DNA polymerase, eukaryota, nucleotide-binding alpha-beta plait domain protein [Tanacetum coccineum]
MGATAHRNSFRSFEDHTQRISHSVYVTNFPDSVNSRDLWNSCSAYGTVIDVFIPVKKSKAGKRFAFVRFIKVNNLVRLVENLCTIWIGRHHLFANQVRYERPQKPYSPPNVKSGANIRPPVDLHELWALELRMERTNLGNSPTANIKGKGDVIHIWKRVEPVYVQNRVSVNEISSFKEGKLEWRKMVKCQLRARLARCSVRSTTALKNLYPGKQKLSNLSVSASTLFGFGGGDVGVRRRRSGGWFGDGGSWGWQPWCCSGAWDDDDDGSGVMMVVELWWAAMGKQPEERVWWRNGDGCRRSLAGI